MSDKKKHKSHQEYLNKKLKNEKITNLWKHYGLSAGIAINGCLGFTYLIMLNQISTQGFGLEEIKTERLTLQKQIQDLDIALAIPTSLYALESNERIQRMPIATNKTYVEVREEEQIAYLPKK